ncbi:MAG: hypothetical protein K1X75_12260 [Leptospirales bacterium]|nr:hypothetical protein [Leptospirales bacterium]
MDTIRRYLSSIGAFAAMAGIVSSVVQFFNYEVRLLMWIDTWGETTAWLIRGGLIVVGALLFLVGRRSS